MIIATKTTETIRGEVVTNYHVWLSRWLILAAFIVVTLAATIKVLRVLP
jgi:hypothetical protein